MSRKINVIENSINNGIVLADSNYQLFIVDALQLVKVLDYYWCVDPNNGYVKTTIDGATVYLHRFLMNVPAGMVVNHKNHNRNDNRLANLEIVSPIDNARLRTFRSRNSKTGYTNITKIGDRYLLQLSGNHIGIYNSIIDALTAKISAAKKLWNIDLEKEINKEIEKLKYPVHIVD